MLPSPLAIVAAVVVAFFVVLTVVRGPVDADYWWHLTTGRLILESGAVPSIDPYSFAYDGPWVAHEWLGELLIAGLIDSVGWSVTAALFGVATAAAILIPAHAAHREGTRTGALVPFVAIATYGLASYATVRPQVLSWVLFAALLGLLIRIRATQRWRPWLVVPLVFLWANLHGLYVVGLGALAVYVIFTLLGRTPMAPRRWAAIGMLVAATAASAVTPAGPAGILYPLRYLRQDDWGTAFIAEWQAIDVSDPRQWGVIALIVGGVVLVRQLRVDWLSVVGSAAVVGALVAVRNGPIAAVAAIPVLGFALDRWLAARLPAREPSPKLQGQRRMTELATGAIVIGAILVILPGAAAGSESETFPTAAFDRLEENHADARVLVDYDWAGYAIYRIHDDGGQVFIDGRSDMYPREVFEDYLAVRNAADGWAGLLDDYRVEAILLEASAPLVQMAAAEGWCSAQADAASVLLLPCDAG